MKKTVVLSLAAAALGLAACTPSNNEPVANDTALNLDDSLDTNLSTGETSDLNASTTTLNEGTVNATDDAVGNLIESNGAEPAGNLQ
jgi:hypothetical protein